MKFQLVPLFTITLLASCATEFVQPDEIAPPVEEDELIDTIIEEEVEFEIDEEKLEELEDLRRDFYILERETEFDLRSTHLDLIEAEEELEDSRHALRHFMSVEMPRRIENYEQAVTYSAFSLKNSEEELAQLQKLYGEAEFADDTAEIVIGRAQHSVEMSRIDLRQEEEDLRTLHKYDLPREIEDYERTIRRAELELEGARMAMELAEIRAEAELSEAEHEVIEMEEELGLLEHSEQDEELHEEE